MSLEFPDRQHFEEACGFVELGLFAEANDALENIDLCNRVAPEVFVLCDR